MTPRRAFVVTVTAGLLSAPLVARAQQPGRVYRIGYLVLLPREQFSRSNEWLDEGLRPLGYIEGRNIVVERRFADGKPDQLPALAAELVRLKVDVIVGASNQAIAALKQATATIPIVMVLASDPVSAGFIASLRRPGGNITGLTLDASPDIFGKQLQLLKDAAPKVSRVAVLHPAGGLVASARAALDDAARTLGVTLRMVEVRGPDDFERAFATVVRERAGAVLVRAGPLAFVRRHQIADLAIKNRLPIMTVLREYAEAGGLLSYGTNLRDLLRRAPAHIDKILKGANPADLPVEQPTTFEFVINLRTAKALGLTLPPLLLARADQVIE